MKFEEGRLLKDVTTFGIGGPSKYFIEVQTIPELQEVIRYCYAKNLRYFLLGKGSNTLFHDQGFDGLVIHNRIVFCEENEGEIIMFHSSLFHIVYPFFSSDKDRISIAGNIKRI